MKPFDLAACTLEGVNLIEASAGTGKTYALAGLFLRFLIENKFTARQLLVITFTNAATAELRSRIRHMVTQAQTAFCGDADKPDPFILNLVDKYPDENDRKRIIRQLNDVLANFDETAIYTIHGFCQRMLADNAFASGSHFDMELIADQTNLEREFARDFWRRHFYDAHPLMVQYAISKKITPDTFVELLRLALTRPDIKIIPEKTSFEQDVFESAARDLRESYEIIKALWFNERDVVSQLLRDPALNAQTYGKHVDGIISDIEGVLRRPDMTLPVPACMVKVSADSLKKKTKQKQKTPSHEIFDLAQVLCEQADAMVAMLDRYLSGLKKEFLESAKVDFPGLKRKNNILYFDDLLTRAREALGGSGGVKLADILRRQYSAVLVDEFQDTDPIQYAIIQSVFTKKADDGQNSAIFYIGDPKQAIYSFRGADIHAYLRAQKNVDARHFMTYNWRSETSLINALNLFFGKPSKPFFYGDIGYLPVLPPDKPKTTVMISPGGESAGLHWWFVPGDEDGKPLGVTAARSLIVRAVIGEIAGLLNDGRKREALIDEKPLCAGDIAILVRTNRQAITFRKALLKSGIPSVVYSAESVFASDEAHDFRLLMLGIIHHEDESYVLAALTTPFFDCTVEDLVLISPDDGRMQSTMTQFRQLRESWRQKGFLTMILELMEQEDVRVRIASRPDGERRLTNYLHLAQLLFQAQREGRLHPSDLLIRLDEMIMAQDNKLEDHEQKLETDRNCVKIVTIHKSKGLEYPIAFCPFGWESGKGHDSLTPVCFHDEKNNWQAVADTGSDDLAENQERASNEALAEDCRLLYVALTRAKNRCYFVWGNIRDVQRSAATYLFCRNYFDDAKRNPSDEEMLEAMRSFACGAPDDIKISNIIAPEEAVLHISEKENVKIAPMEFKGILDQRWKIASYTYLSKAAQDEMEWDEQTVYGSDRKEIADGQGMLQFPPGATSGILLHEILEKIDFTRVDDDRTKSIIKNALEKFNYDSQWQASISDMLRELTLAELTPPGSRKFKLSDIGSASCLRETEFYFPLQEISSSKILSILERQPIAGKMKQNRKLNFSHVKGYLKGFIDLIFEHDGRYYLADWKSNDLSDRYEGYTQNKLEQEIFSAFYDLQYLIYSVALDLYLKKRLPDYDYEKHFGGVYYFFLRGIHLIDGESEGIYFDRPDKNLIQKLTKTMLDQAHCG